MNPDRISFRPVPHRSADYQQVLELRNRLLRQPLGLVFTEEDIAAEAGNTHFALIADQTVIACAMAVPCASGTVQIRQMAVTETLQGQGFGRALFDAVEEALAAAGITRIFLHARETAIGFYERMGYHCVGERFVEVGITHARMEKILKKRIME